MSVLGLCNRNCAHAEPFALGLHTVKGHIDTSQDHSANPEREPSQPTQRWSRLLAPGPQSRLGLKWPCGLLIVVPGWEQKTGPHGPTGLDSWEELCIPTRYYQLT